MELRRRALASALRARGLRPPLRSLVRAAALLLLLFAGGPSGADPAPDPDSSRLHLVGRRDAAGVTPAAPGVTPAAPGVTPAAPGVTPAAPGVTPAAPGVTSAAPGVTSAAPGVTPAAPGVTSAAPGVTSAAPKSTELKLYSSCGSSIRNSSSDPTAMTLRWPWVVSVQANDTHVCAGSIITLQWVVVAAHCVAQQNFIYSVLVGSTVMGSWHPNVYSMSVAQVLLNPRFRLRRYWSWIGRDNDIALLKLHAAIKYKNDLPENLWSSKSSGLEHSLMGGNSGVQCLGAVEGHPGKLPQFQSIQEKQVMILDNEDCDQFYHIISRIPSMVQVINSYMFCAKDTSRNSFCYEESGEPMSCLVDKTWYLVGLVSWGPGCEKNEAPPIYLHIPSYRQWIMDCINGPDALPPGIGQVAAAAPRPYTPAFPPSHPNSGRKDN
ncbi:PREDICTED: probable threonine protease PRSS50 [Elephantulus edwardii]|uniref:probable threonine protease PRSS50 n=1 Tax=Elephantulus edwardii TaxID=28737 RepID=UPI0003F07899|nr:PREDICTED: probable threonine protease PRSS50 [Elephantulus edwardii]